MQWELSRNKGKRILNTQMFVKAWAGTWFGFVEKMFMLRPGRRNLENFLAKTAVVISLYSRKTPLHSPIRQSANFAFIYEQAVLHVLPGH